MVKARCHLRSEAIHGETWSMRILPSFPREWGLILHLLVAAAPRHQREERIGQQTSSCGRSGRIPRTTLASAAFDTISEVVNGGMVPSLGRSRRSPSECLTEEERGRVLSAST